MKLLTVARRIGVLALAFLAAASASRAANLELETGTYVGDGAANRDIVGMAFKPELLIIKGDNGSPAVVRTSTMANGLAKELGTNLPLASSRILTFNGDGFTVGSDPAVNAPGVTYTWSGCTKENGQVRLATYNGNGVDDRAVTGVGFQPVYVMILPENGEEAMQRFAGEVGDASLPFGASNEKTDRIQLLLPDGFEVGRHQTVNESGIKYHYVALGEFAGLITNGTYAGDDTDDRGFASFRPDVLMLTRREDGSPTVYRSGALTGDRTLPLDGGGFFADGIQALRATGFEIGAGPEVNAGGKTYFWVALRHGLGADLDVGKTVSDPWPNEGDPVTYTVTLTNYGPESANGVEITDALPAGVTYVTHTAAQGSYEPVTGVWNVGNVPNGVSLTLTLDVTVGAGTAGTTIQNVATITASGRIDPHADNDSATAELTVPLVDLAVTASVDDVTPTEGQRTLFTVVLRNLGPHPASGIQVSDPVPAGLTWLADSVSAGSYDAVTGLWSLATLAAGDSATLRLEAAPDPGTAGTTLANGVAVIAVSEQDPAPANDAAVATVTVQEPVMRLVTGSYVGNGASSRNIGGVGFQPDAVLIKGESGGPTVARTKTFAGDAAKPLGVAVGVLAGQIRSLDADGFTVGSDSQVNAPGVTYHWQAFLEAPGQLAAASYLGNGQDNRSLGGIGFRPGYVMVLGEIDRQAFQRFAAMAGDSSRAFGPDSTQTDRIQALEADGFQLGKNHDVNRSGTRYHYLAWNDLPGIVDSGTYDGDAHDDRDITLPGFRPEAALIARQASSTVLRPASVSGDVTFPADIGSGFSDAIQTFLPDGFQVGKDDHVNKNGRTYWYAVFRDGGSADLALAKFVDVAEPNEGDTITYTLTLRNYGPATAGSVEVTDVLPSGLTFRSATPSQGSYDPGSGVWSVGTVPAPGSVTLDLAATVDAGTGGSVLTNSARVTASGRRDPFVANDAASVDVTVRLADLALTKTTDDPTPGELELVRYTVLLRNLGPSAATGITVADSLPAGVAYWADSTSQGAYDPGAGVWAVGTIAPGDTASLVLSAVVDSGAVGLTIVNAARILASDTVDPIPGNNADSASVVVQPREFRVVTGSYVGNGAGSRTFTGLGFQPDLVLVRGDNGQATAARTSTMTGDATKPLDGGTALVAGAIRSLQVDGFTIGADSRVNSAGVTYYWTAFRTAAGNMSVGSYAGDDLDNRSITGVGFRPSYLVVLGEGAHAAVQRYPDQTGDASLPFTNSTPKTNWIQAFEADGFQVGSDTKVNALGTRYHWVAWGSDATLIDGRSYMGNGGGNRLIPGFRPDAILLTREDAGSDALVRVSTVPGSLSFPVPGGAALTQGVKALEAGGFRIGGDGAVNSPAKTYHWMTFRDAYGADLRVAKVVDNPTPSEGTPVRYVITVTNHGPQDATGVRLADALPAGVTYAADAPLQGTYDPGTGVWTVGELANGAATTLTIDATVDAGTAGQVIVNTAGVDAVTEGDPHAENDTASAAIAVQAADLAVVKTVSDATPSEGDPLRYRVVVTNRGPDPATGVAVTDVLPAGVTYGSHSAGQGTYTPGTGVWAVGALGVGASTSLDVDVSVDAGTTGSTIVNVASVSASDQVDPDPANDSGSAAVTVQESLFRIVTGTYVGDGTSGRAFAGIGFQPDVVIVKGEAATRAVVRTATMAGDAAKELGINAPLLPGRIASLDADGFTIGPDVTVNGAGTTFHWTALRADPNRLVLGSYVGNEIDDRNIDGVGFRPSYLWILGAGSRDALQRFPDQTGDAALEFSAGGIKTDRIQAFRPDGFQIGGHDDVNELGFAYHWVAWTDVPGLIGGRSYAGNGQVSRSIAAPFRPDLLIVRQERGDYSAVHRSLSMSGDLTLPLDAGASLTNEIRSLRSTEFEIGSGLHVNEAGELYHWMGFRDETGADLEVAKSVDDPTPNEGDAIVYTVTVRNFGPEDAVGVEVTDPLPAGVTWQLDAPSQGSYDPVSGIWTVGDVGAGATGTLAITATVDAGTSGEVLTNTATITAGDPVDRHPDNDTASVDVFVQATDLEIVKTVDDATPTEGETIRYTVLLVNRGPDLGTGISVTDLLPAGVTHVADSTGQGSYDAVTGQWVIGSVAAGDTVSLLVDVRVDAGTTGTTIVNTAAVQGVDQIDPDVANNSGSVSILVQRSTFRLVTGSYTGDGASSRAVSGIGFQPDVVIIKGESSSHPVVRTKTMEGDAAKPLGANAALLPGQIRSLDADGFTVGSGASVNSPGVTYHWQAFLEAAGELVAGSYVGNGLDDRSIGLVGFRPEYVMVLSSTDKTAYQRHSAQAGDASLPFQPSGEQGDRIQAFEADGFQVGKGGEVNALGVVHHFVAWANIPGRIAGGLYLGDGLDDRPIGGVGFRPVSILVVQRGNTGTAHRTSSVVGDLTLPAYGATALPNAIQAFQADGFQIGSDPVVNSSGKVYVWTAFRDVLQVDLAVTKTVDRSEADEGDPLVYVVTLTNRGPENATGVQVMDLLPAGVTYQSHTPSQGTYAPATGQWVLGAVNAGSAPTLRIDAVVGPGRGGTTIRNVAAVTAADQMEAAPGDESDFADVRVLSADLAVSKTVDDAAPDEGDLVTFTVKLRNLGPDPASGISLSDPLPAGLSYRSDTASQGGYTPASGLWTVGVVAAGDSAVLSLSAEVDAGTAGALLTNVASVAGSDRADPVPGNDSAAAALTVRSADLSLSKLVDVSRPDEGDTVTFTIVVRNDGPNAATGVAVSDLLPAGLSYLSHSPSQGTYVPGTGMWTVGNLANGNSATLVLRAVVDPGTTGSVITNTASVVASDQGDPDPDNDIASVSVTVSGADLVLAKTVDDPSPNEGATVQYLVAVSNTGPDDATGVVVTDLLPAGVTYVGDTPSLGNYLPGTGAWTIGTIAVGDTVTLGITATVDAGTGGSTITNSAAVTATEVADPAPGNESASVDILVQSTDLAVQKVVNNPTPPENATISYTVTLINLGPLPATGVEVTDPLPVGVTYVTAVPSQGTYDAGTGVWTVGAVSTGGSAALSITARVNPGTDGLTLTNTATITAADQADPSPGNDAASVDIVVTGVASPDRIDLVVGVGVDDPAPAEADTIVYTVTLGNLGPDGATGVEVVDLLPPGLTYVSATPTQGTYTPATGAWTVGALAAGGTAGLTLGAEVDAGTAGSVITNAVFVTGFDQTDVVGANNSASVAVTVQSADLEVTKTVDRPAPNEGDTVTYTVRVRNLGPQAATGVVIADSLPAGVTFLGSTPTQGTYSAAAGTWSVGALADSATATLTIRVTIDAGTGGSTIVNTAVRQGSVPSDPQPANDTGAASLTVQSADVAVLVTVDDATPRVGDTVSATVMLSNHGPIAASGITVSAPVPAGLTYRTHLPGQGTYVSGTGVWSVGAVAAGGRAMLEIRVDVPPGSEGLVIPFAAAVAHLDQSDPDTGNDEDSSPVVVRPGTGSLIVRSGTYTGDGTGSRTVTGLGFRPDFVLVKGDSTIPCVARSASMPADVSKTLAGAAISTDGIRSFDADGFTVGAAVAVNTPGVAYSWVAFRAGAGQMTVGSYAGDGSDNRLVDGIGFAPDYVIVMAGGAAAARQRFSTELGDASLPFGPSGAASNRIQAFHADGFQVGDDSEVNEAGRKYHYVAWDAVPAAMRVGYYAGDGLDDRDVTGLGLLPEYVLLKAAGTDPGVQRAGSAGAGDVTLPFDVAPSFADGIQQLADDRFQIGTSPLVNRAGTIYHWVAFAGGTAADLRLAKTADRTTAAEGDTLTYTIALDNLGPSNASGITVSDPLPGGLVFLASAATQGGYDAGSGVWATGSLARGGAATLSITARVAAGTGGLTLTNRAVVASLDQLDPVVANDADSVDVAVPVQIRIAAEPQPGGTLLPGGASAEVLRLRFVNSSAVAETLQTLAVTNSTTGPGTPAQLDAEWQPLDIFAAPGSDPFGAGFDGLSPLASAGFSGSVATFAGLGVELAPGDTVSVAVLGGASLAARDGEILDVRVDAGGDVQFAGSPRVTATWPMAPAGFFVVDGMSAAQIAVADVGSANLLTGSVRNPVFSAVIPPNGYQTDVLERVNVRNAGDAVAGADISRIEAWVDSDDDAAWNPAADALLGTLSFTGIRWEITGLSTPIPLGGLRLFFTCDLQESATEGRTVRLVMPPAPDEAVGVASSNDGPVDMAVVAASAKTVSTLDRVTLTAVPRSSATVHPGDRDRVLLHLLASNNYGVAKTIEAVAVENATRGGGSRSALDGELDRVALRVDGDGDGLLDGATVDPVVGTGYFQVGSLTFTGLGVDVGAGSSLGLFVTGDVSLDGAADGDTLAVHLEAGAVTFTDATSIAAGWPLDSGCRLAVDGMVAAQIVNVGAPIATLGPDEEALAMSVIVPANGYAGDVLQGLVLENLGTATSGDIADLRLWRDGGDGSFEGPAPGSDDIDLGPMTPSGGRWSSPIVSEALPGEGAHLFVSVTVASAPADSASLHLRIPVRGITVASSNDGPVDVPVANPDALLLSTAALLATAEILPSVSTVGQTVTARLTVRNDGDFPITGITPSALSPSGSGLLTPLGGPAPASFDLAAGAESAFVWTLRADGAGPVQVAASASGTEVPSAQTRRSLQAPSNTHRVYLEASDVDLFPVESMPFSVNRGQADVVPLSLTFASPASGGASDIRVSEIRFRVDDGSGGPIVPADIFSRVRVNEGSDVYLDKTALETSGDEVVLTLAPPLGQPARIESSGGAGSQVTLSLSLEILASTAVPTFRISIPDSAMFTATDDNSGAPVAVRLRSGAYPIRSGTARVLAEPTRLEVAGGSDGEVFVVQGETGVTLLSLELVNPDSTGLAADVRVSGFDVSVIDSAGTPIADPQRFLKNVRVQGPLQTFLNRPLGAQDDTTLALVLSQLISLPAETPFAVSVVADIADSAGLETFRVRLAEPGSFDARDASTGAPVPVLYASDPLQGSRLRVERPAEEIAARGVGLFPASLTVGDSDVPAMRVDLVHPGVPGTGPVRCEAFTLRLRDERDDPLPAATYLDRIRVLRGGVEIGTISPTSGADSVTIPLAGLVVPASQTAQLEVLVDVEAAAPASFLELVLAGDGIRAVDDHLGAPVIVSEGSAGALPISSTLTRIDSPPRDLVVGFEEAMPPVLASDGGTVSVATLVLTNPAPASVGSVRLDHLEIVAGDDGRAEVPIGPFVAEVEAFVDGELWAGSGPLEETATRALLAAAESLEIRPAEPRPVEIRLTMRDGTVTGALRVGVRADGIGVVQPQSALLAIDVSPQEGMTFPFWTELGSFSGATLRESWSNFPNPFAAGRQGTTFAFYLDGPASITLSLWSPRGRRVRTLLEGVPHAAGLHQDTVWDGRNGVGEVVVNGVYVAEIDVAFDDGRHERLLRKVAVVR